MHLETKYGFIKMSLEAFAQWMSQKRIGRTVIAIQQHHTYIPSYHHFKGDNHFELQKSMHHHHTVNNGWMDIGQHFTIFPDGVILTGRSLEYNPAGIFGNNQNAICIENFGFFDAGQDEMTKEQKESIVGLTAIFCEKFNLPIHTNSIVYHHWFNFFGERNDGAGGNKTCPGDTFFGGNKVQDCKDNFLPLVAKYLNRQSFTKTDTNITKYAMVTANALNVRTGSHYTNPRAKDREPLHLGAVIRVYKEENNWYKISKSREHWISSRFTTEVKRYVVTATSLNVRSGPSTSFPTVGQIYKGNQVFVNEIDGNWHQLSNENKWVHGNFLRAYNSSDAV